MLKDEGSYICEVKSEIKTDFPRRKYTATATGAFRLIVFCELPPEIFI